MCVRARVSAFVLSIVCLCNVTVNLQIQAHKHLFLQENLLLKTL